MKQTVDTEIPSSLPPGGECLYIFILVCETLHNFLDQLASIFCDVKGDLLPEWACLTLQGGTTFHPTSNLADIPVSKWETLADEWEYL